MTGLVWFAIASLMLAGGLWGGYLIGRAVGRSDAENAAPGPNDYWERRAKQSEAMTQIALAQSHVWHREIVALNRAQRRARRRIKALTPPKPPRVAGDVRGLGPHT